tara:strand:+ start:1269 stop:1436 length:168 start_codon:yes stop_codon:yes gene_type:complete
MSEQEKWDPLQNTNQGKKNLNNQAGKGSGRRPTNENKYRENYDRIFGNKDEKEKS